MKCWVNTISRDHLRAGVEGGFTQAGDGKAVGRIADEELYQVEMAPGFVPWRRNVEFVDCTDMFRRGLFEIPRRDFHVITRAMGVNQSFGDRGRAADAGPAPWCLLDPSSIRGADA
jgi:hypothetical protein